METAKFSPRAKCKKRLICVVKGCNSTYNKDLEVRFHYFPPAGKRFVYVENVLGKREKIDQLTAWMKACRLENVNSGMKVCSLHFRKNDYILPDVAAKRRYLKTNAVPSCNLPTSKNTEARDAQEESASKISSEEMESQQIPEENELIFSQQGNIVWIKTEDFSNTTAMIAEPPTLARSQQENNISIKREEVDDRAEVHAKQHVSVKSEPVSTDDFDMKVQNDSRTPKLIDFISSDAELRTLTGIESSEIFDTIVAIVSDTYGNRLQNSNDEMSIRDKVLMTYVKLKQNMNYDCLAILIRCCSAGACQRIFFDMIRALSVCLKSFIKWASRETIAENMPQCFEGLEDVRVILDSTEIFIQQPKKLQTCKFMTGVTPAGQISYVSRAFGGQTSDKAIFNGCDMKNLLQPGDAIMVVKGFIIDQECMANKWKCYRSPLLRENQQLSKSQATLISRLAKAREHIERSTRRIKEFKIVGEPMPSNLMTIIEEIFLVICGTLNLSSQTIKREEFT